MTEEYANATEKQLKELPFTCPNCNKPFGWGDGSAPIFLGVVNNISFNDEPTPCCGYKISGTITRDLVMEVKNV